MSNEFVDRKGNLVTVELFPGRTEFTSITVNAAAQQGVVIDGKSHGSLADVKTTLGAIKAMAGRSDN